MLYEGQYDSQIGPIMSITIGTEQGPQRHATSGLLDTGSTYCGISAELVQSLGLISPSLVLVRTARETGLSPAYFITVQLPNSDIEYPVGAVECIPQEGFDVLIGRNVLRLGLFQITADRFSFTTDHGGLLAVPAP